MLSGLFWCCACGLTNYNVTRMTIDENQHLIPVGSQSLDEPSSGPFYFFFHTGRGSTTVAHLEKRSASTPELLLYLETDREQRLDRTVKSDLLLVGDFGTIFVKRTCIYNHPFRSYPNSVSVQFFSNGYPSGYENPTELSGSPKMLPPLTSVSIIRVLHLGAGYLMVKAEYEANGEFRTINGAVADGKADPPGANITSYPADLSKELGKYGMPAHLNVTKGALALPNSPKEEETFLFVRFYDFGKLIQREQYRGGILLSSKWLQPSVTEEERTIGPECDARFRQQLSLGLPTTGD